MDQTEPAPRWLVLPVLCTGMLMVVVDTTAVNVALPQIRTGLGFSPQGLAWVVNGYLISFGGLLLLAGRLGDLLSRRTVFLAGLLVFTAASLACGIARDQATLIGARFTQGIGAAMLAAVSLGIIAMLFPDRAARARAISAYSFVSTVGGSAGLVVGGPLTQVAGWRWVFFLNVPIGAAAIVAGRRWLGPDAGAGLRARADYAGAALITAAVMLGVYATVCPAARGSWGGPVRAVVAAMAVAALAGFAARQASACNPLIPVRMLRAREVATANIVQALLTAAIFAFFFLTSLDLRLVLGYGPLQIGLAFLPLTGLVAVISLRYAGRLIARHGAAATLLPGLALTTAGLLLFARAPAHGPYLLTVLPVMAVLGAGVGLAYPAVMVLAMSRATEHDAGLASGLINTTVQVAGALGLAVLTTLATRHAATMRAAGDPPLRALASGYHVAVGIGAGLVLAAIAVTSALLAVTRASGRASASRHRRLHPSGASRAPAAAGSWPASVPQVPHPVDPGRAPIGSGPHPEEEITQ